MQDSFIVASVCTENIRKSAIKEFITVTSHMSVTESDYEKYSAWYDTQYIWDLVMQMVWDPNKLIKALSSMKMPHTVASCLLWNTMANYTTHNLALGSKTLANMLFFHTDRFKSVQISGILSEKKEASIRSTSRQYSRPVAISDLCKRSPRYILTSKVYSVC